MSHAELDAAAVARACRGKLDEYAADYNARVGNGDRIRRLELLALLCRGAAAGPGRVAVTPEDFALFAESFLQDGPAPG